MFTTTKILSLLNVSWKETGKENEKMKGNKRKWNINNWRVYFTTKLFFQENPNCIKNDYTEKVLIPILPE